MFPETEEIIDGDETNSPEITGDDSLVSASKPPLSKASVIGFGVIVAALVVFGWIHLRSGPSAAAAGALPTAAANQTISDFLSGGANNLHNIETSLQTTQKQVWTFQNYPSVQQVPLKNLKTNPFAYRGDDKSGQDSLRKQAAQQAQIEAAAQALKLQSIMYSNRPRGRSACMINNSLYSAGEHLAGFTVDKINSDSVVITQGSFRFELRIQR